jgi:isopenicillin-N N-acyltransferase-like protein
MTEQHSVKTLQKILRDHVNYPDSICNHAVDDFDPLDREKTITSLVMDLTSQQMYVCWGNPCINTYHTYDLNG